MCSTGALSKKKICTVRMSSVRNISAVVGTSSIRDICTVRISSVRNGSAVKNEFSKKYQCSRYKFSKRHLNSKSEFSKKWQCSKE